MSPIPESAHTMTEKTSPSLLGRLQEPTDTMAWREFFDRYWRPLFAFAKRRGCSDDSAEDVVQETMLAVFGARNEFLYDPNKGRFRNWLFTIVCQKIAVAHRRIRPRVSSEDVDAAMGTDRQEATDGASEFERLFELGLLAAAMEVIRGKVEPATYQAFELTQIHDFSAEEAAKVTGLTRNGVYLARKRVLQSLEDLFADYHVTGQLCDRLKAALELVPHPKVIQALTSRVESTFTSVRQ